MKKNQETGRGGPDGGPHAMAQLAPAPKLNEKFGYCGFDYVVAWICPLASIWVYIISIQRYY